MKALIHYMNNICHWIFFTSFFAYIYMSVIKVEQLIWMEMKVSRKVQKLHGC